MLQFMINNLLIVINAIQKIWRPAPIMATNNFLFLGGLNTSPWTSFQPVSSSVSSCSRKFKESVGKHLKTLGETW
jgi:hypothetical protein